MLISRLCIYKVGEKFSNQSKSGSQSQQKQLLDREEIAKLEEVQEVMSASIVQVYQIDRQTEYQCCLHVEA